MRIPLISATLLVILTLLLACYILSDIRKIKRRELRKGMTIGFSIFSAVELIAVIVFLCWPKRDVSLPITVPMWLLYSLLTVLIPEMVYTLFSLAGRIFKAGKRGKRNYAVITGAAVACLIFVSMWWGAVFTRNEIDVNEIEVSSKRLPEAFDGFRVLQFSDIHLGSRGHDTTFVAKLVDRINEQNADMVCFTGDFVDRASAEMLPFMPVLRRIKAPYGVYAINGNHDYGGYADWPTHEAYLNNLYLLYNMVDTLGWKLLKNQSLMVGNGNDSIAVIGVENWGEPPFNKLGDLIGAYPGTGGTGKNLNDSVFKLLMTHNPNHWTEVVTKVSNVDLTLSGHTHAMQFAVGAGENRWSPSVFKYKKWGGLYEDKSKSGLPMYLYVNIGAGEVGYPARLGVARPEINVITLRREK